MNNMNTNNELKELVKKTYSEIALKGGEESCCSGSLCCSSSTPEVYNLMNEDYTNIKGYEEDADLGLGCERLMYLIV